MYREAGGCLFVDWSRGGFGGGGGALDDVAYEGGGGCWGGGGGGGAGGLFGGVCGGRVGGMRRVFFVVGEIEDEALGAGHGCGGVRSEVK